MGNRIETQDRLIAATRQIIIEEGVEATSLEHICKVAGFTRGAFYSNFASKDSLLAAMAEDEYADLIDRLRATVEVWATRGGLSSKKRQKTGTGNAEAATGAGAASNQDNAHSAGSENKEGNDTADPLIENLLFEALDAIGVNKTLYVIHSELLSRSIRDPEWGGRLLDINLEFLDELGRVLEWILSAAHRRRTIPLPALVHSVIGIVIRAAGIEAWHRSTRQQENTAGDGEEKPGREPAVTEVLKVVQLVLYGASEPLR